ncbi:MAG: putative RDD family membrane protein YckC, partial [Pirellulaceae bacterium]
MSETRKCSHCKGAVLADSPLGLCPQCLLIMGMDTLSVTPGAGDDGDLAEEEQLTHGPNSLPPLPTRLGDYQIQRLLGKGGMGVVYEAEHLETGRRMALKLLAQGFDSSQRRTRFIREGRLAAAVNHPHSVYVYGTEEINGVPAIAMELVDGGTLRDRVKESGPMPIGEVIDAILQVISGLEAAQEVGVLHRDVKPANCFIDLNGKTKIGDYGLSISNEAQAIPDLSSDGRMLGTPAYASPEQLRGEPLDVRSDIYSLGATLYYLLTGRHPFDADDLIKMLSLVFETPAPNPKKFRSDIPDGICEAVLRCLSKQAGDRFHSYEELRQVLVRFRSSAPTPATYGRRILAGYIDQFIIGAIPTAIVLGVLLGGSQPDQWTASFRFMIAGSIGLIGMLYFGLLEGTIGASIGKRICGLRVVSEDRSEPSFLRILGRSSLYLFVPAVPAWTYGFFVPAAFGDTPTNLWEHLIASSSLIVLGIVFCCARKSNGWAGLHELASHTRVVMKPEKTRRPVIFMGEPTSSNLGERANLGPFHILQTLRSTGNKAWYLGFDPRLLRRVWLRGTTQDQPTVADSVRDQKRATRLRWIGGRREEHDSWDAFEAPKGQALLRIIEQPQSWDSVRYWLIDLAEELIAAQRAGNVPTLALDRIWITSDGRVKLLDFPVPSLTDDELPLDDNAQLPSDFLCSHNFLKEVAVSALSGHHVSGDELDDHSCDFPLPLHARRLLMALTDSMDLRIWT